MLAPLLFIGLCYSLYNQVVQQRDLSWRWAHIRESWQQPVFWAVVALMFVNYLLEAKKWQILIKPLQSFSLWRAFKSVMAGCSITMLTPNRIGEYGGRILFVQEDKRLRAISLNILGSISQLVITVVMGTMGLLLLKFSAVTGAQPFLFLPAAFYNSLIWAAIASSIFLLIFYFRVGWLVKLMERVPYLNKPLRYVRLLEDFKGKQLLRILFLSLIRYMAFILQYMLLLQVMEVEVQAALSFWLLSCFYLVMALAPTIGFTELPLRATATVEIFKLYSPNLVGIQAAALGIWIINLVLPAIIGSVLIFGIKIAKEDEESP